MREHTAETPDVAAAAASAAQPAPRALGRGLSPDRVLKLQRQAGNAAVCALLQRAVVCPPGVTPEEGTGCYETADPPAANTSTAATADSGPSPVVEGAAGVAYGTVQAITPGGFMAPSPAPNRRRFEYFRAAGETATGLAEIALGVGGEALGGALDVTGIGALVGVPLNVASAALIAHGAVNTVAGGAGLIHAMSMSGEGEGGGGSGRRELTDDEKWEQAKKALEEQEKAAERSSVVTERYPTPEAAVGQVEGNVSVIKQVETENAGLRNQGFTKTWYVEDANGTQWTVHQNPRTGEFTGAHHSSSN